MTTSRRISRNHGRTSQLSRWLLLLATILVFIGCGGSGAPFGGATENGAPPADDATTPIPQFLSLGSKEMGEIAIAQMRTSRAIAAAARLSTFVQAGAQAGQDGPFTVELANQAGGSTLVTVRDTDSGTVRGVLVAQPPIANADGTTTVTATLGEGEQGFFGSTGAVTYSFNQSGLASLRFDQLLPQVAAGEYDADLVPPPISGTLTLGADGFLRGQLTAAEGIIVRGFWDDPFGYVVDLAVQVGTWFMQADFSTSDGSVSGSSTTDASFTTTGSLTNTTVSGDTQSMGYFGSPGGVGQFTGMNVQSPLTGSRPLPGAGVIGQNGGNVIGQNGGNVIGQNGGNVIGQNGGNVIGQNGGNVIGQNGGNVIGQNGGNVIGQNGGNILIPGNGAAVIGQNGGNVIGQNGGNAVVRSVMAFEDVDRDAPSTLGASFPARPSTRLRLLLTQPPTSENVQARTGDSLIFIVRAEDAQGRPIPYSTNLAVWSASSGAAKPTLFMDPNSSGRYVAVNPGTATVFFNDLNAALSAQVGVSVNGAPVVVPGTIFFSGQPEGPQSTFAPLNPAPVVRVLDTNGNPMAGVNVTLEAVGEGAGFVSATRSTDSTGAVAFGDFLLPSPGTYFLIGRAAGLAVVGNSFAVATGRTLVSLRILAEDGTTVQAGRTLELRAEGTLSDGSVIDASNLVDWVPSNQNARVTSTGLVSGVFAGSVTIEILQKAGAATRSRIELTITAPPVRRRGLIYIADSGAPASSNGEILVAGFETGSGVLDKSGDTLNVTQIPLSASGSFTAARPFDLLLNSDATRLIVGTDGQARVYEVNRTDGNLQLFSPGPAENNFPGLRHLIQSGIGGVTNRYYGVSEGTMVGAFRLNANGSLTRFRTWVMPDFVRGLESFQVGSDDFVYVNLGDSLRVLNVATGAETPVAIPPNLILNPGLVLTFPSGPVLSMGGFVLSGTVGAPHLLTLPIDSSTGMPNANQFTFVPTVAEPRGLAANTGDDTVFVGSFTESLVDAFVTDKFPSNPTRFSAAPFASTGAPEAFSIGGSSRELVFALTSPQGTLDVFKLQLAGPGFSLTRVDTARVGGGNVQDVESTVVGNQ